MKKPKNETNFLFVGLAFQASAYRGSKILHLSTSGKASRAVCKLFVKFLKSQGIEATCKKRIVRFPNGSTIQFQGADE